VSARSWPKLSAEGAGSPLFSLGDPKISLEVFEQPPLEDKKVARLGRDRRRLPKGLRSRAHSGHDAAIGTILGGSPGVETASEPWRTKKKERQGEPISNRGSLSPGGRRARSRQGRKQLAYVPREYEVKVQSVITLTSGSGRAVGQVYRPPHPPCEEALEMEPKHLGHGRPFSYGGELTHVSGTQKAGSGRLLRTAAMLRPRAAPCLSANCAVGGETLAVPCRSRGRTRHPRRPIACPFRRRA